MGNPRNPDSLAGVRVALLQGRRSDQLSDLVRRQGGSPVSVEAVREVPLPSGDAVASALSALQDGSIGVVVFSTGAAASALLEEATRLGRRQELIQSLQDTITICRGPKPAMVLRHLDINPTITIPAPYTAASLLAGVEHLDLRECGVALLHYGQTNSQLAAAFRDRGARLTELCLYEWMLPEDVTPLRSLVRDIIDGEVDAVAFTSQVQARHLFAVARETGEADDLADALNDRLVVASLAPTCAAGLRSLGVEPHVVPELSRMGPLVLALGEHFALRRTPEMAGPTRWSRRHRNKFAPACGDIGIEGLDGSI